MDCQLHAKLSLGGRVSQSSAKKLLQRQLGDFASNLENVGFVDVKTGRISGKMLGRAFMYLLAEAARHHASSACRQV